MLQTFAFFIVTAFLVSAGAQTPPPATEETPPAAASQKKQFGKPIFSQAPSSAKPAPAKPEPAPMPTPAPAQPSNQPSSLSLPPPKPPVFVREAPASEKAKFVGTWEIVMMDFLVKGKPTQRPGFLKPRGRSTYDSAGRTMTVITDSARTKFEAVDPAFPDLANAPPERILNNYTRMLSYSGTYRVLEGKRLRILFEAASIPNFENNTQDRLYEFKGDTLTLTSVHPTDPKGDVRRWIFKRVK